MEEFLPVRRLKSVYLSKTAKNLKFVYLNMSYMIKHNSEKEFLFQNP